MNAINTVSASETPQVNADVQKMVFKPGWQYGLWLARNGYAPSPDRYEQWLEISREASKAQVDEMRELAMAGAKTKVSRKAVFNARDQRWDTSLTARVVRHNCTDAELITDALTRAMDRQSKRLADMKYAASKAGVLPVA